MLLRVVLLASAVCLVAVMAAGRAPEWVAALALGTPHATQPSERVLSAPANASVARQATLRKGMGGHVLLDAFVNGSSVPMMVDTGASLVTLSGETAQRLGIAPLRSDYTLAMNTANGIVRAAPVRLRNVRIGEVELLDVDAVVMPAGILNGNLLGMSFLNRLRRFEFTDSELVLTQ